MFKLVMKMTTLKQRKKTLFSCSLRAGSCTDYLIVFAVIIVNCNKNVDHYPEGRAEEISGLHNI